MERSCLTFQWWTCHSYTVYILMCLQTLKRCNRWLLAFLGWTWQGFTICNRLSRNNLPCERLASHLLVFIDASMHGQYFEQLNLTGNFLISHGDGLSEPLCNIFWSPSFYPPAQVLPYCRWWSSITPGRWQGPFCILLPHTLCKLLMRRKFAEKGESWNVQSLCFSYMLDSFMAQSGYCISWHYIPL